VDYRQYSIPMNFLKLRNVVFDERNKICIMPKVMTIQFPIAFSFGRIINRDFTFNN
jgi:hypothetical protein